MLIKSCFSSVTANGRRSMPVLRARFEQHLRHGAQVFSQFVQRKSSSESAVNAPQTGDFWTMERSFSKEDVAIYGNLSRDMNPVHFDGSEMFGGPIVHGMLVGSLFGTIVARQYPGAIYSRQELRFRAPVYVAEQIIALVTVTNVRHTRDGLLKLSLSTVVQKGNDSDGKLAIDGCAVALVPSDTIEQGSA